MTVVHMFHGTSSELFGAGQVVGGLEMPVLSADRRVAEEQARSIVAHYGGYMVILVVGVEKERLKPIGVTERHLAIYQGQVPPSRIQVARSSGAK